MSAYADGTQDHACDCRACRPVCVLDPADILPLTDRRSPILDDPRRIVSLPYATETRIVLPCGNHGQHTLDIQTPEDPTMGLQHGMGDDDDLDRDLPRWAGRLVMWAAALLVLGLMLALTLSD